MKRIIIFATILVVYASLWAPRSTPVVWAQDAVQDSDQDRDDPDRRKTTEQYEEEIRKLQERIRELEEQNRDLAQRVSDLQHLLIQQRDQAGDEATDAEEDPLVLPEDTPLASPDALFEAVRLEYEGLTGDRGFETDRERRTYVRELRSWIPRAERKYRGPVEWCCEIQEREALRGGDERVIVVIRDPETRRRWSEPFEIPLPRKFAARLDRFGPEAWVIIGGFARLQLTVDERREEPGEIDVPRLVGPFVEFECTLQVSSLVEAKDLADEVEPPPKPAGPGG